MVARFVACLDCNDELASAFHTDTVLEDDPISCYQAEAAVRTRDRQVGSQADAPTGFEAHVYLERVVAENEVIVRDVSPPESGGCHEGNRRESEKRQ